MNNLGNNLPSTSYEDSESLIMFQTPDQKSHLLNSLTDGDLRSHAANNEMLLETKKTMVKYELRKELCNVIEKNNDLKRKMEVSDLENIPTKKRSRIDNQLGHVENNPKNKIELSDLSETSSVTSGASLSDLDKKFDTLQNRLIKNVKLFRKSDMYINNFIVDRYFLQDDTVSWFDIQDFKDEMKSELHRLLERMKNYCLYCKTCLHMSKRTIELLLNDYVEYFADSVKTKTVNLDIELKEVFDFLHKRDKTIVKRLSVLKEMKEKRYKEIGRFNMKRTGGGKDIERCKEVCLENSRKGNDIVNSSSSSSSGSSTCSNHSDGEVDVVYPDLDGNDISVTCRGCTAPEIICSFDNDEKLDEEIQPPKKKIKKEQIDSEDYFNDSFPDEMIIIDDIGKNEDSGNNTFVDTLKKQSDIYVVEQQFKYLSEKLRNLLMREYRKTYGTGEDDKFVLDDDCNAKGFGYFHFYMFIKPFISGHLA